MRRRAPFWLMVACGTSLHAACADSAAGPDGSSQLDAAQLDAAQLDAAQLDAAQLDADASMDASTESMDASMDAAQLDAAQLDADASMDASDVDSSDELDGSDVDASDQADAADAQADAADASEGCPEPGNLLVLFDRSGSMAADWNGAPRWQAAGTALIDALTPLADDLTLGMVGFPSPDAAATGPICTVTPIASADQVTFKAGPAALTELQSGGTGGDAKYLPILAGAALGATPTTEAVMAADAALDEATLTGITAVMLITDGAPNCSWDQQATVDAITGWRTEKNVLTYVIGLPGLGSDGPLVLEALAQAGGTGPAQIPASAAALEAAMSDIAEAVIGTSANACSPDAGAP